jgi:hypothetical protein
MKCMEKICANVWESAVRLSTKQSSISLSSQCNSSFLFASYHFKLIVFFRKQKSDLASDFRSVLQVFFKASEFFPFVLRQQLTTLDFVSYCGGSLGLFLGFSALSAVEVVYYLTIRWMFLKYKKRRVSSEASQDQTKSKNYMSEFMENSSIHGFNQTVKDNRHIVERFGSCE